MNVIELFNKYNSINKIDRTGWTNRGIKNPESVSEHIMSCILIAFCFLPDNFNFDNHIACSDKYDKYLIINLLLIHDLGEVDIGDKIRGTKTIEEKCLEYGSINNFLCAIKMMNSNSTTYDILNELWVDMESGTPKNINAKIAKEIDYIQGAYQYFIYCISNEVKLTKESCFEWLNEISDKKINTSQGRKIRNDLILKNPNFVYHESLGEFFIEFKL